MNHRTNRPKTAEEIGKKGLMMALEYLKSQRISPEQVLYAALALDIAESTEDQKKAGEVVQEYTPEHEWVNWRDADLDDPKDSIIDEFASIHNVGEVLGVFQPNEGEQS